MAVKAIPLLVVLQLKIFGRKNLWITFFNFVDNYIAFSMYMIYTCIIKRTEGVTMKKDVKKMNMVELLDDLYHTTLAIGEYTFSEHGKNLDYEALQARAVELMVELLHRGE